MKSFLIKAVALTTLSASVNVSAQSAVEALSVESIKATLTQEQIQLTLNQWKEDELKHMELRAQRISDKAPIEARREIAKSQIEQEYKQTARALGL